MSRGEKPVPRSRARGPEEVGGQKPGRRRDPESRMAAPGVDHPRCPWPGSDELMVRYHDEEWGTPVHDDIRHFEFLVLDGAQAGLSWRTILYKRENYRVAFAGFDPRKVARFDARKVERLLLDPGIVRNRTKVEGAVLSARAFLLVQKEFGSFDAYVWAFTSGRTLVNRWETMREIPAKTPESEAMSKDLVKRGFKFVGPTICYAYMQAAGIVNDHAVSCFRWREVQEGSQRG
jgi:DNA-3-methyladenine glycosylase I